MSMKPEVLIFSTTDDAHAAAVSWALEQNGVNVSLTPSIRKDGATKVALWADEERIGLESSLFPTGNRNLRSVWNRRVRAPDAGICHEADRDFIAGQWRHVQSNIFSLSDGLLDALWINRPEVAVRAENKLVQIKAARDVGLAFPEMVVTNDVQNVKAMLGRWPRVVFKTFYPHNWKSASTGNIYSMSVKLLDRDSPLPEESIALCPGIYQRYIDKAFDVRVTVMGEHYFAVRMRSNKGSAYVDWRDHMTDEDIVIEVIDLPAAVEAKLRALMGRLGLVFGCIDLVVDAEGDAYFLEVNQAGQFLFLEEAVPQLPLLKAMTAMLSSGRNDYSIEGGGKFGFSDFLLTDDYQQVVQTQIQSVMPHQNRAVEA